MHRVFLLLLLLFFAGCDFIADYLDGPYNTIPCRYNLEKLYDTLKPYGLREWGGAPKGFHSKSAYNPSDLDCSSWDIYLQIDTANGYFFNERFVLMLARKVFDEPANDSFQQITFDLRQKIEPTGSSAESFAKLTYLINRHADTVGLGEFQVSYNSQTPQKIREATVWEGREHWRTVDLEIDSIPANPYEIAKEYFVAHQEFPEISISVRHVRSKICREVKYWFWFDLNVIDRLEKEAKTQGPK